MPDKQLPAVVIEMDPSSSSAESSHPSTEAVNSNASTSARYMKNDGKSEGHSRFHVSHSDADVLETEGIRNRRLSSSSLPDSDSDRLVTEKKATPHCVSLSNFARRATSPFRNHRQPQMTEEKSAKRELPQSNSDPEITELLDPNDGSPRERTTTDAISLHDFHTQMSEAKPVFSQLSNYMGGIHPSEKGQKDSPAKLGTMLGVYLPCIQNIFGIMMFARLPWLVGNSGLFEMCAIGILCCITTFLTTISISALATNGSVPGGGAYFIISRTLGPEIGGSIGFLFFLGNAAGCAMYIAGGVEILLMYLAPQMAIPAFGPLTEPSSLYNHCRLYGTVALIIVFCVVCVGIRFVAIAGFVTLAAVLGTILLVFIGFFTTNEDNAKRVCMVGIRVWRMDKVYMNGEWCCVKDEMCPGRNNESMSPLYQYYCGNGPNSANDTDLCNYFNSSEVGVRPAVLGLTSGEIANNLWPAYADGQDEIAGSRQMMDEDLLSRRPDLVYGNREAGEIVTDMATSFLVIIGIFFPSVTGILAGSNRSGDLANPGRAIPSGTIGATMTTTICYFIWIVVFAATMPGQVLRDKMGESMTLAKGGSLMAGNIAWPHPIVAQVGSFLATMGASLQSLTSAPRLLNAVAKDDVIPFLKPFAKVTKRGEPFLAQLLAAALAECGILLGTIDLIGPVVTMFFLICYTGLNISCCINSLLQTPNWRPRFRFYHWSLSATAVVLAVIIMFLSNWWQALIAIGIGVGIYKYIEFKGAEKDWGDGVRGVQMTAALAAIQRLPLDDRNVRSWRPQFLVFLKAEANKETNIIEPQPISRNLLAFTRQLKAGKGLVVVGSVVEGSFGEMANVANDVRAKLMLYRDVVKMKAMPCVVAAPTAEIGMATLVQSTGIGALRPNTVVIGWPFNWKEKLESQEPVHLLPNMLRVAQTADMSTIVIRNAKAFPVDSKKDRITGTTDLWWIVEDCGLLLMIPYLLQQHRVWEKSKFRIFVVTMPGKGVSATEVRNALKEFVYDLRINCSVDAIEMDESDISAYVYQRTLTVQDRGKMLSEFKAYRSQAKAIPEPEKLSEEHARAFTLSPIEAKEMVGKREDTQQLAKKLHSAYTLNQVMLSRSSEADLVVVNMPAAPKRPSGDHKYMEYVDLLTEGFSRVLLIRSSQSRNVVTTKFAEN